MMQDVRMHKIDCIIVKDLSRFGRNHIETGNYIEKIFPFLGVRFIAVADHFDSVGGAAMDAQVDGAMRMNLKNLVNEMYAWDISAKVRAGKQARRVQGSYTGGVAAYGYRAEWDQGKKRLIMEEETAQVVKEIYGMFLSGNTMKEIKRWLYKRKIHRPTDQRKTGHVFQEEGECLQEWPASTIKGILSNPVYTGCLVQGAACGRDRSQGKWYDVDISDHSIQENTHEAIISEDIFVQAAVRLEQTSVYSNKKAHSQKVPVEDDIYSSVFFCGECSTKMSRVSCIKKLGSGDRVRHYYYRCPHAGHIDEMKCAKKYISKNTLSDIVKVAMRQEIALAAMQQEAFVKEGQKSIDRSRGQLEEQKRKLDEKIGEIKKRNSEQYLKYRMGRSRQERFIREKEKNDMWIASLEKQKEEMGAMSHTLGFRVLQECCSLQNIMAGDPGAELTKDMIHVFISRIEIYQDHRVKILFAFQRAGRKSGERESRKKG